MNDRIRMMYKVLNMYQRRGWKWVLCAYEHNEYCVKVLAKKMRLHSFLILGWGRK